MGVVLKSCFFDRSGFQYHGRVKALAEAARENGLSFLIFGDFQMAKHEIEERGDGLIEEMSQLIA